MESKACVPFIRPKPCSSVRSEVGRSAVLLNTESGGLARQPRCRVAGVCHKTVIGTDRGNGCPAYSALPHPLKKDMDEKVYFFVNCIFLIFLRKQCVKK